MKHKRGINLVGDESVTPLTPAPGDSAHAYRLEIWTAPPEAAGELIETINRSTNFNVSVAARHAAMLECPGKYIVHMNGRHRMSCDLAPASALPSGSQNDHSQQPNQAQPAHEQGLRLSDMAQWYFLAGVCQKYNHVGSIDRWEIARKFGANTILQTLFPNLRCTSCGNKIGNRMKFGKMKR